MPKSIQWMIFTTANGKSAGADESKEQAFTGNTGAFLTGTAHVMENRKSDGEKSVKQAVLEKVEEANSLFSNDKSKKV